MTDQTATVIKVVAYSHIVHGLSSYIEYRAVFAELKELVPDFTPVASYVRLRGGIDIGVAGCVHVLESCVRMETTGIPR